MQNNALLVLALHKFYAKSSSWCKNDIITMGGKAIKSIWSEFGLHQVINEPANILESSSLCTDLVFTSQQSLITESGIHPSLHPNSNHQIIFAKSNMKILYSLLYFVTSGTTYLEILILSDEQLICLIRTELLEILMLMKRCLFFTKLFWIYFLILFPTKH